MKPLLFLLSVFSFLLLNLEAATYYIDYTGGSDANNGTATSTPWKRQPYMVGFTGSYAHTAGDRFIFKGGVTWPSNVFQLKPLAGGSSASVRDYYGVDQTWYAGGAWTRPLFDFENSIYGLGYLGAGVLIKDIANFTFDNLELTRHRADVESAYLSAAVTFNNASNILIANCVVRDWDTGPTLPDGGDGGGGGINGYQSFVGTQISNCVLYITGAGQQVGYASGAVGEIAFCTISNVCNAALDSSSIHDNHIHDIQPATDPLAHENAILVQIPSTVYNNKIYNVIPGITGIFLDCAASAVPAGFGPATNLVYNNVIWNCGQPMITDASGNCTNAGYRIYNNTIVTTNTAALIRNADRGEGRTLGFLDIRNNHLITTVTNNCVCYNGMAAGCGPVTDVTVTNNLFQTYDQAAANGFTEINSFSPAASEVPTINVGLDLSTYFTTDMLGIARPSSLWDIGAYEFVPPPPNSTRQTSRRGLFLR